MWGDEEAFGRQQYAAQTLPVCKPECTSESAPVDLLSTVHLMKLSAVHHNTSLRRCAGPSYRGSSVVTARSAIGPRVTVHCLILSQHSREFYGPKNLTAETSIQCIAVLAFFICILDLTIQHCVTELHIGNDIDSIAYFPMIILQRQQRILQQDTLSVPLVSFMEYCQHFLVKQPGQKMPGQAH